MEEALTLGEEGVAVQAYVPSAQPSISSSPSSPQPGSRSLLAWGLGVNFCANNQGVRMKMVVKAILSVLEEGL